MSTPTTVTPPRHIAYLDAARGLAALMVLFGHYVGWRYHDRTAIKYLHFVLNESDAVSFFFVLSGMVLSYQYAVLGNSLDIRKFFINRFFRLFPAFFITVLLNTLYVHRNELTGSGLYDLFIRNKAEFWEEAILVRSRTRVYIPGWTLVMELAISFFIPFFIVWGKANRRLLWWVILTTFLVTRVTETFIVHFLLGTIISFYYNDLRSPALAEKKWYRFRYLILAAAVVLFSIRQIDNLFPFGPTFIYLGQYFQVAFFHYTGLASFVFIIWMMRNPKVQHFLSHKFLLFIGKISYGIYLVHWLILMFVYDQWDRILTFFPNTKTAFLVMMALCFGVSVLFATILHYTVELPFIRMGKRITAKLKPSLVIR